MAKKYTRPERRDGEKTFEEDVSGVVQRIAREKTPLDQLQLREDDDKDALKNAVRAQLVRLAGTTPNTEAQKGHELTPEDIEYLRGLILKLYPEVVATIKFYELTDKSNEMPNPETLATDLAKELTHEQIEFIRTMGNPVLTVDPGIRQKQLVTAIDAHKCMPGQIETYVSDYMEERWSEQDAEFKNNKILYRASITEGVTDLDEDGTDLSDTLKERRVAIEKKWASIGVQSPYIGQMVLVAMNAIQEKKPMDKENWSVLHDPKGARVAECRWSGSRLYFGVDVPGNRGGRVRFRPSVVVDVPKGE